ncbi:MAG TPA: hypothetical protein VGJ20_31700, partial [Xanthobacteraceae bacterium]
MRKLFLIFAAFLSTSVVVFAQAPARPITHAVIAITVGTVFQQVLPPSSKLEGLTIENNNTNGDNCWLFIGSGNATTAGSSLLA